MATGTSCPRGQAIDGPAPVDRAARGARRDAAAARRATAARSDLRELPGGVSNTTHGEGIRRGVGYAVGFKNVGFSGGFDDYSTARVRLSLASGEPQVEVHTAACEVGQGGVTVQAQIARDVLGVERVIVLPADTAGGERRLLVGLAADLVHGRRGAGRLRGGGGGGAASARGGARSAPRRPTPTPAPDRSRS